jgi:hypothetical protein
MSIPPLCGSSVSVEPIRAEQRDWRKIEAERLR